MNPAEGRVSVAELRDRRQRRASRFLVTGATGFLGSHLAAHILRDGYSVVWLVRPKKELSAEQRVSRLLDWFEIGPQFRKNVRVVDGEVTKPNFGLNSKAYADLLAEVDEIIHCASDTSFSERKRKAVEQVNVEGLKNVLDFAERSRCLFFHHLSTAYVAGRRTGVCPEELASPAAFTNVYEETKCRSEKLADERCRRAGIRLSIYRPSIVYGDAKTGKSLLFNALYYPVRTVLFLRDVFAADMRERGGRRAAEMGVRLEDGGWTYLPIRMEVQNGGGLDLVPVDFFVRAFTSVMDEALDGGIFHLVCGRPKKIAEIIDYGQRLFRIRGVEVCLKRDLARAPRNGLEALLDDYLQAYQPYLQDERLFGVDRVGPILAKKGVVCPELDYDIFSRCMDYAVDCGWGARLFSK
jgi:nucleoside-diphosphate-sugar epimerase